MGPDRKETTSAAQDRGLIIEYIDPRFPADLNIGHGPSAVSKAIPRQNQVEDAVLSAIKGRRQERCSGSIGSRQGVPPDIMLFLHGVPL